MFICVVLVRVRIDIENKTERAQRKKELKGWSLLDMGDVRAERGGLGVGRGDKGRERVI